MSTQYIIKAYLWASLQDRSHSSWLSYSEPLRKVIILFLIAYCWYFLKYLWICRWTHFCKRWLVKQNKVQNKPNHTTDIIILILSEPCFYCTDDFVDFILFWSFDGDERFTWLFKFIGWLQDSQNLRWLSGRFYMKE